MAETGIAGHPAEDFGAPPLPLALLLLLLLLLALFVGLLPLEVVQPEEEERHSAGLLVERAMEAENILGQLVVGSCFSLVFRGTFDFYGIGGKWFTSGRISRFCGCYGEQLCQGGNMQTNKLFYVHTKNEVQEKKMSLQK